MVYLNEDNSKTSESSNCQNGNEASVDLLQV